MSDNTYINTTASDAVKFPSKYYSRQLLEALFSMFGIPHIVLEYGPDAFLLPALIFALAYLIFGYLASGKVKKVSSRELITE